MWALCGHFFTIGCVCVEWYVTRLVIRKGSHKRYRFYNDNAKICAQNIDIIVLVQYLDDPPGMARMMI